MKRAVLLLIIISKTTDFHKILWNRFADDF
jgi:hypothetical protein